MTTIESGAPDRDLNEVLKQAGAFYLNREYGPARQLYAELVADPRYAAEGQYGLGMVALVQGDLDDAQGRLHDCVRRSPGHHRAMVGLGLVAERRGDVAQARQWYVGAAQLGNQAATRAVGRLDSAMAARAAAAPPVPSAASGYAGPTVGVGRPAASGVPHSVPSPVRPNAAPVPMLARQPSGKGVFGRVSSLQSRQEPRGPRRSPRLVVMFRVERDGHPPLPVELRGEVLKGSVSPGDYVEIPHKLARGRPVNSAMTDIGFWNLTIGGRVRVQYSAGTVVGWILLGLLAGFVLAVGAGLLLG